MNTQSTETDGELCAHCKKPRRGNGVVQGVSVCHTGSVPPWREPPDCYRLVTIYGQELGNPEGPRKRIV